MRVCSGGGGDCCWLPAVSAVVASVVVLAAAAAVFCCCLSDCSTCVFTNSSAMHSARRYHEHSMKPPTEKKGTVTVEGGRVDGGNGVDSSVDCVAENEGAVDGEEVGVEAVKNEVGDAEINSWNSRMLGCREL